MVGNAKKMVGYYGGIDVILHHEIKVILGDISCGSAGDGASGKNRIRKQ